MCTSLSHTALEILGMLLCSKYTVIPALQPICVLGSRYSSLACCKAASIRPSKNISVALPQLCAFHSTWTPGCLQYAALLQAYAQIQYQYSPCAAYDGHAANSSTHMRCCSCSNGVVCSAVDGNASHLCSSAQKMGVFSFTNSLCYLRLCHLCVNNNLLLYT